MGQLGALYNLVTEDATFSKRSNSNFSPASGLRRGSSSTRKFPSSWLARHSRHWSTKLLTKISACWALSIVADDFSRSPFDMTRIFSYKAPFRPLSFWAILVQLSGGSRRR
uniref:Uncharacterized protein n=1 Tax=Romanomermis culicivorax TaxID=13658 RepID=A0A915KD03_ROMCU